MNLTPHALNLAGFTVPPSGTVARVEMVHPVSIPCWEVRPGPVIDLPEVDPDALFRDDLDFTADPERTPSRGPKGNLTCANCGGRATDHHACSDGTIWSGRLIPSRNSSPMPSRSSAGRNMTSSALSSPP